MLFANLAKADEMIGLLKLERGIPKPLSTSKFAIDQLMDCFVKGAEGAYNKNADYDYLSYFFADLAKVGVLGEVVWRLSSVVGKGADIFPQISHIASRM